MIDGLNRALEYIESNLRGEIDTAEMARLATTSEYHFRRMFSALAGIPVSEYIRRRRLTVAGAELSVSRSGVLETAVKYGYSSAEAFTRAFTAFHGVSPGAVKRAPAVLKSQPKLVIHVTLEGATPMDYMLVEKPALTVVGFKARVPLVHEGPNSAIEDFTRSVDKVALRGLRELSDQEPAGIVSVVDNVAHPRTEGTELDYYLGVVTGKPSPTGFDVLTVDAHTWAVFTADGSAIESVQYLWRDIYTEWFPANPFRSVPGPEIMRTEYNDDFTVARFELWIPVESELNDNGA
ncbi:AraC family transcriptional regulator [Rhodococcus sp. IC4_135]|uniref:GyrI-like domain-containing protein n=1 Tax=Rhodococcus sp. IC4_135 TaxID=2715537 RepID=UPI00141DADB2|nr:AraC family transcriptional regulator [Rhodococcus sp. IC4_135]